MCCIGSQMQLTKDEGGMRLAQIVHPFVSLGASLLLGATAGVGISAFVNWRPSVWRPMVPIARRVPPAVTVRQVPRCCQPQPTRNPCPENGMQPFPEQLKTCRKQPATVCSLHGPLGRVQG